MEGPFLSPPAKRPFYNVSGMPENDTHNVNGVSKRGRSQTTPNYIALSPGQVALRLVCHVSTVGGVIGKSGNVIKQLQQETGAKIRVEEPPSTCDERVIHIVALELPKKKIILKGASEEEQEEQEVSPAQEALVKVFERVLEVDAETQGVFPPPGGVISCRLLGTNSQVGSVMGKGGSTIERIKKESGSKIRVLPAEKLPACASPNEQLIQIMGDVLAVKKALIAVSCRLQDCTPVDKVQMAGSRPVKTVPRGNFPDPRGEVLRNQIPPAPISSVGYVSSGRPVTTGIDRLSTLDPKKAQQEVAFRLLCPIDKVGGIIGKGGSIVRILQNETGSLISIGATVAESEERVITVSASEDPDSQFSPAQHGIVRVFTRSIESGIEKGLELGSSKGGPTSARLLVKSNEVGCLMGKGGAIISELRRKSGTGIRILSGDQVPKCASENDQVVQVTGEFGNVRDALFHVTGRLRANYFPSKTSNNPGSGSYSSSAIPEIDPYGRIREPTSPEFYPSVGLSHNIDRHTTLTQSMDHLGLSRNLDRPPSPRLWVSQKVNEENSRGITDFGRGFTTLRDGLELGRGSKSAIVTNTTVEIVVPENVIGSVYGDNGSNLARLRKISGAKVIVHDPVPGKSEGTVIISGLPEQTQIAQSLLQAFILNGSSPEHRSRLL